MFPASTKGTPAHGSPTAPQKRRNFAQGPKLSIPAGSRQTIAGMFAYLTIPWAAPLALKRPT